MKVAVTGAGGFLGGVLSRALCARGDAVRACVHRADRAIAGLPLEPVRISLEDPDSLVRAFRGVERVYHAAGFVSLMGHETRLRAVNVEGTRRVVEACRAASVRRLLHVSSIETLLPPRPNGPVNEAAPPSPEAVSGAYARTKAQAERVALSAAGAGLEVVLVNPTALMGPYDFGLSQCGRAILALALGRMPALMPGDFDWVDVRDVAQGCILAAERGQSGERYLLNGETVDLVQLAAWVAERSGRPAPRIVIPGWLARIAARVSPPYYWLTGGQPRFSSMTIRLVQARYRFDRSKAERELGYRPRPAREAIFDALDWFREAGYLQG